MKKWTFEVSTKIWNSSATDKVVVVVYSELRNGAEEKVIEIIKEAHKEVDGMQIKEIEEIVTNNT